MEHRGRSLRRTADRRFGRFLASVLRRRNTLRKAHMTNIQFRRFPILIATAMTVLCLLPSTTSAQLNGSNIKGDAGVKAGSQPPPGAYVAVPLWFYTADAVKRPRWQRDSHRQPRRGRVRRRAERRDPEEGPWRQLRVPRRPARGKQPRAGRRRLRRQSRRGVDGHVRPADQPGLDDSRAPTSPPPTVCSFRPGATKTAPTTIPASAWSGRKSCSAPRST